MAADADTPDRQLSKTAEADAPRRLPDDTDEGLAEPRNDEPFEPTEAEGEEGHTGNIEDWDAAVSDDSDDAARANGPISPTRLATVVGLVMAVGLSAVLGWLGFREYNSYLAKERQQLFVQVGRQAALNLTTIDWQQADTDVERILDSATGTFYDEFSKQRQPFIDLVKKAQSKSVGTITEAGLEMESDDEAQTLVAVSVKTSNLGATEQAPRAWRMRISVKKIGDEAKVSKVEFVP